MDADHLRLDYDAAETLARQDVVRVEIRKRKSYLHHIVESAALPVVAAALACSGPGDSPCNPLVAGFIGTLFSPVWAYTAVTTPVFLGAEAVSLMKPAQTFEIIP